MPGFEFPMRTPTSVLFFFAAAGAAYYSLETPQLADDPCDRLKLCRFVRRRLRAGAQR